MYKGTETLSQTLVSKKKKNTASKLKNQIVRDTLNQSQSSTATDGGRMAGDVATVFVHTNLATRLCFNAPPDITVRELKKYFEKVHFSVFPDMGEIRVTGILVSVVELGPHFYHLDNSQPMKIVFPGMGEPWFLRVEIEASHLPRDASFLSKHGDLIISNPENKTACSSEEKRSERFHPCSMHQLEQCEATNDAVKEKKNSHENSTPCEHQLEQHEATNDAVKEKGNSLENSTPCDHQSEQREATNDAVKEKGKSHESSMQNAARGTPERRPDSFGDKPTGSTNNSQCVMPERNVEKLVESHANSVQGSQSKMSTQVISVTGLINKYFSGFNVSNSSDSDVTSRAVCSSENEVQSDNRAQSCSKKKIEKLPHSTPKTSKRRKKVLPQLTPKTPVNLVSKTSGSKNTRFIVGERLLSASKSFGGSITKRSPSLSVCRFNDRRDKSQINGSIFSISDSDN